MNGYDDLEARWKALRRSRGIVVREVACVGAPRTLLSAQIGDAAAPEIALASGVHGDEPAAAFALLSLAEDDELDLRYAYRIWPCTNPSGFRAGTRENAEGVDVNRNFGRGGQTPEARAIVTANRDRKFVLSIDLHEDCDTRGFYCYEYGDGDIGARVAAAVRAAGFPVEEELDGGVLRLDPSAESETIGGISYTMLLARHAARRALTFETPSALPWETRIAIHRIAVKAAIAGLANP